MTQCATGNPVPVPVDPVIFLRFGFGFDRPDLAKSRKNKFFKFWCRICYHVTFCMYFLAFLNTIKITFKIVNLI